MEAALSRRDLIRLLGGAGLATLQLPAFEPGTPLFFSKEEFALLDCLTELIIPADDHSPGAHDAEVAAYIDRSVAEAFLPEDKRSWREGLASVNSVSKEMNGVPFLKASREQQVKLLNQLAAAEQSPKTQTEKFFTQLKQTTAFAYYSSSIGIHQDMEYKGNVILDKFVGYDAT